MEKVAKLLNIDISEDKNEYVVQLEDSNAYQSCFNDLDNLDDVELDEESVEYGLDNNVVEFYGEGFKVKLVADFFNDKYEATLTRLN